MRSAAKYIWIALAVFFIGGFLFYESSGLFGRAQVTTGTAVATVNGRDISYLVWSQAVQNMAQQREEQTGRGLTLDERRRVEDEALDQLVNDVLLEQEYKRRGIRVTDQEIQEAAQFSPPPQLMRSPELQTEGRFDPQKYQRMLRSPAARAQGLYVGLEQYYRGEIPKQKLFEQVAADVYVTDPRLWSIYQDAHDSAQISYVMLKSETVPDSLVTVTDAEVAAYYEGHKKRLERRGRAVVSVLEVPRTLTAADTAATRAKLLALRTEISGGASFDDVAKRESSDTGSAKEGGKLGTYVKGGGFVPEFERAAYALKPGQLSDPVQTPFGFHLLRVDERKGDTLTLRHILLRVQQSDTAAMITDRRADSLAAIAASAEEPAKLDSAAKTLRLVMTRATVVDGDPLMINGRYVAGVSAWAFGGARVGETSELLDSPDGYYLARLDSLQDGGLPTLAQVTPDIRTYLAQARKAEQLVPRAQALSRAAAGSSLEAAASAASLSVVQTPMFNRLAFVPGVGQFTEVIGAAFAVPVGAVSPPVKTRAGVFVFRVDRRANADRAAWEAQKSAQRQGLTEGLRQQRVREYLDNLRDVAKIEDHRKKITAAARRATS